MNFSGIIVITLETNLENNKNVALKAKCFEIL